MAFAAVHGVNVTRAASESGEAQHIADAGYSAPELPVAGAKAERNEGVGFQIGPLWTERFFSVGIYPSEFFQYFRKATYSDEEKRQLEAREHYFQGCYFLEMDEPAHALGEFEAALEGDPDNAQIMLRLAEANFSAGKLDAAEQVLNRILKKDPKNVQAMLFQAQISFSRMEESVSDRKRLLAKGVSVLENAKKIQPGNLDVLKALAQAYFQQQDIEKIVEAHRDILKYDPRNTYSLLILANVLSRTGNQEEAIEYYERVIEQRRGFINTYVYLAQLYEDMKRFDDALATYKRALLVEPRNEQLVNRFDQLATQLAGNGDDSAVLKFYRDFATEYPFSSEVQRLYADKLLRQKEYDAAIEQYKRVLELDSDNVEALIAIGNVYMQLKKPDEATEYFSKAIDINPEKVEIYDAIAANLIQSDDEQKAAEIYEKAIRLNPKADRLYVSLAGLYGRMEKYEQAVETMQSAIEKLGEKPELMVVLAQVFEAMEETGRAIETYEKAYRYSPDNMLLLAKLISLNVQLGQEQAAEKLVEQALRSAGDRKAELLAVIAETYYLEAELEKAAEYYAQALEEDRQKIALVSRLVHVYNGLKRYDESLKVLEKAEKEFGDSEDVVRLKGDVFLEKKDYDKAISQFRKLVEGKPDSLDPYRLLADAQVKAERSEEAIKTVEQAQNRIGPLEEIKAFRGTIYFQLKRYDAAEQIFKQLAQGKGRNSDTYQYFLGSIYLEQKRFDAAERAFRQAIELNPNNDNALNALGYMLADRGMKLQEAEELLKQALALNPGAPHILDSMGWLYFRQGKIDKAREYIEKAARYIGEDAEVYDHLGDIYEAEGDLKRALEFWKKSLTIDKSRTTVRAKIQAHEE